MPRASASAREQDDRRLAHQRPHLEQVAARTSGLDRTLDVLELLPRPARRSPSTGLATRCRELQRLVVSSARLLHHELAGWRQEIELVHVSAAFSVRGGASRISTVRGASSEPNTAHLGTRRSRPGFSTGRASCHGPTPPGTRGGPRTMRSFGRRGGRPGATRRSDARGAREPARTGPRAPAGDRDDRRYLENVDVAVVGRVRCGFRHGEPGKRALHLPQSVEMRLFQASRRTEASYGRPSARNCASPADCQLHQDTPRAPYRRAVALKDRIWPTGGRS